MRLIIAVIVSMASVFPIPVEAQGLRLALAAAADFTPVYAFDKIPANIRQIAAIVDIGTATPAKLVASYIRVGDNAGAPDQKIAEQQLAIGDGPQIVLHYAASSDWIPGKYRLELAADSRPWLSAEWDVVPPLPIPVVHSSNDIMPLLVGTTWPMAFTSRSSPQVTVTLPAAERDADGVYHMKAAINIPGGELDQVRVRHTRNGKLAEEELWQVDVGGIAVVGRAASPKPVRVDPPLPIIPFPLPVSEKRWNWRSSEAQYEFRGWGPVLLKGPDGEQPGYVILMERPTMPLTTTFERDLIPGLGIVREIFVHQSGRSVTLFHQEYVLTGLPIKSEPDDSATPSSKRP